MAIEPRRGDAWVEDVSIQMNQMDSVAFGSQEAHPSILGRQHIQVSLIIEPHSSMDLGVVMEALHNGRGPSLLRALADALDGHDPRVLMGTKIVDPEDGQPETKKLAKGKTRAMEV